jgi:hypothetical protein
MVAHAAPDVAIANYADQRFTSRNGILVIREHPPKIYDDAAIEFERLKPATLVGLVA